MNATLKTITMSRNCFSSGEENTTINTGRRRFLLQFSHFHSFSLFIRHHHRSHGEDPFLCWLNSGVFLLRFCMKIFSLVFFSSFFSTVVLPFRNFSVYSAVRLEFQRAMAVWDGRRINLIISRDTHGAEGTLSLDWVKRQSRETWKIHDDVQWWLVLGSWNVFERISRFRYLLKRF